MIRFGEVPPVEQRELVIKRVSGLYPKARPDSRFWTKDGKLRDFGLSEFVSLCDGIRTRDSSPGLPFVGMGFRAVGSVLSAFPGVLCTAVKARLKARIQAMRDGSMACEPKDLVERGLRDPVRVFVKNEPHSEAKIAERRFRLIMNSGLVDILCDRVVFDALCEEEIVVWDKIPSKPGMGLDDPSVARLVAGLPEGPLRSLDAKAWDWSYPPWLMEDAGKVEMIQYGVTSNSDMGFLIMASAIATMRKVLVLSDGKMFAQTRPGVQESGSRMTAARNSKGRVLLGAHVGAETAAMGDDAVERCPTDPIQEYHRYGFRMEEAILPEGVDFEFCSSHFRGIVAEPQNWHKTFFRLLHHKPDVGLISQFKFEMRHSPHLPRMLRYLRGTVWGDVM